LPLPLGDLCLPLSFDLTEERKPYWNSYANILTKSAIPIVL